MDIDLFLRARDPTTRARNLGGRAHERGKGASGVVASRSLQPRGARGTLFGGGGGEWTLSAKEPVRIFYFRHGETQWSLSGQHTGVTDIPLTTHGETQARALRPWVEALHFAHVFSSPRARARATCDLAGLAGRAQIDPELAEWNYGDYEGRRTIDIREGRPGWNIHRDGCPNGESPDEIGARVDRVIARLRALDGDVAVFAHGQLGGVFVARWIGLAVLQAEHFQVGPASMGVLGWEPREREVPVVTLWNAAPGPDAPGIPGIARRAAAAASSRPDPYLRGPLH
jgi:probable phosphoglycerate mutase